MRSISVCLLVLLISNSVAAADEENASNPLAKVKNTDLRWQYLDLDGAHLNDVFIDGAFMANDKLKTKYELHYWKTNITGQSENGLESAVTKSSIGVSERGYVSSTDLRFQSRVIRYLIQVFSSYRGDPAFNERMRQRAFGTIFTSVSSRMRWLAFHR